MNGRERLRGAIELRQVVAYFAAAYLLLDRVRLAATGPNAYLRAWWWCHPQR